MSGSSLTELVEDNNDILLEILVRVNPECIFSCIFVSKPWLELITSPSFRRDYLKRWKRDYLKRWKGFDLKLVGFSEYYSAQASRRLQLPAPAAVPLVPISEFGRAINRIKLMSHAGYFIGSTPDGLILSGEHPNKYFVHSLTTRQRIELPPLPVHYKSVSIAIFSHDQDDEKEKIRNFEVIYAKSNYLEEPDNNIAVSIQTFSSLTGEWRPSTLSGTQYFGLCPGIGTVARGVVYWSARAGGDHIPCFAAYNTNKEKKKNHRNGNINDDNGRITLLNKPWTLHDVTRVCKEFRSGLGVTSEGILLFVSFPHDLLQMFIWMLDDDNFEDASSSTTTVIIDDSRRWRFCYEIDVQPMMMRNQATLSACHIEIELGTFFRFEAFVPGDSDSVFLTCNGHIFVYHRPSQKLEAVHCYLDDDAGSPSSSKLGRRFGGWPHPVTVSGLWPSSPFVRIAAE